MAYLTIFSALLVLFSLPAWAQNTEYIAGGTDPFVYTLGMSDDGRYVVYRSLSFDVSNYDQGRLATLYDRKLKREVIIGDGIPNVRFDNFRNPQFTDLLGDTFLFFEDPGGIFLRDSDDAPCDEDPVDCTNYNLYRYDLQLDKYAGVWPPNGFGTDNWTDCHSFSVSADGRSFAMICLGSDFRDEDPGQWFVLSQDDVFFVQLEVDGAADVVRTDVTRVSVDRDEQGNGPSTGVRISADGKFLVYTSEASNLVPSDTNSASDVFVYDVAAGSTERVSVSATGELNGNSGVSRNDSWRLSPGIDISADGRFVVFTTEATGIDSADTTDDLDIYIRDRDLSTTTLVSKTPDFCPVADTLAYAPQISGDSLRVTYLADCDGSGAHLISWDRLTGVASPVDYTTAGALGNGEVTRFVPSSGGHDIAYISTATNLTSLGDTAILYYLYVGSGVPDADGDGLPDAWETTGIDLAQDGVDLNLAALGADPNRKDLFIEYDYLDGSARADCGASHAIGATVRADLIQAFANAPVSNPDNSTGITLHFDTASAEAILETDANRDLDGIGDVSAFHDDHIGSAADRGNAAKAQELQARRLVYRYLLMGHGHGGGSSSGQAELPGNDVLVTLGEWGSNPGTAGQQAGTIMHEYGHSLGLRHGGHDHTNCKPNYLSIMSYSYQTPKQNVNRVLDYSRTALVDLDEWLLDEATGIGGLSTWTAVYGPDSRPGGPRYRTAAADGPIDWDLSGGTGDIAHININHLGGGCVSASDTETLEGSDDWSHIVYNLRATQGFLLTAGDSWETEMTWEDYVDAVTPEGWVGEIHPVAAVGADFEVDEGTTVTLDGTPSSDPNGEEITYRWTQDGEPLVALDDAYASQPIFTAPWVDEDTELRLELVVYNADFDSVPVTLAVLVRDVGGSDTDTDTDTDGDTDSDTGDAPDGGTDCGCSNGGNTPLPVWCLVALAGLVGLRRSTNPLGIGGTTSG